MEAALLGGSGSVPPRKVLPQAGTLGWAAQHLKLPNRGYAWELSSSFETEVPTGGERLALGHPGRLCQGSLQQVGIASA